MDAVNPDRLLDCEEVVRALWEYLDGHANDELRAGIDEHLARCDGCRAHFEFERRLVRALGDLRTRHLDAARLRAEVLAVLGDAGFGGTDAAARQAES